MVSKLLQSLDLHKASLDAARETNSTGIMNLFPRYTHGVAVMEAAAQICEKKQQAEAQLKARQETLAVVESSTLETAEAWETVYGMIKTEAHAETEVYPVQYSVGFNSI